MTKTNGGGDERLAPVTPIFGGRRGSAPVRSLDERREPAEAHTGTPSSDHPAWRSRAAREDASPEEEKRTRLRALRPEENIVRGRASSSDDRAADHGGDAGADPVQARERAEALLVRKLRARALSIAEARGVLRESSLHGEQVDDIITEFCRRGYLDDAVLAEHLVRSGSERKGMGRVALGRALSTRGLTRDVIDAALAELPDDDAARALGYAQTKAASLTRLDFDTALRRLVGQLTRRGYSGGVAMTAARRALEEAAKGARAGGVRFVESD